LKILIADDDPVSRRLMERTLQKSGYAVVTAQDGAQAFAELSRDDGPRLALLDWEMPELDGLEVCRRVRSRPGQPYIYITLLTSKLSNSDVVAGLEAGSDDYLTKPCNPEELKARLRTGQRILRLEDTLIEAREGMRFKATHDALTGLWNQGAILTHLRSELSRSAQEHVPLSLLLCDVDHFKAVNDAHGHLVGDDVLRQVAGRLQESVRSLDPVGRYGGEEFLIVLTDCADAQLRPRAEQVREAVDRRSFPIDNGSLSISLSVGAMAVEAWKWPTSSSAMAFSSGSPPWPVELLLKEVDAALYLAKTTGRNRVVRAVPQRADSIDTLAAEIVVEDGLQ
jgi:two-component system, cell cycle response regulator